jgi:hypothetical protein
LPFKDILDRMNSALSSLVSLCPVVLGAVISGYGFADAVEPKPLLANTHQSTSNFGGNMTAAPPRVDQARAEVLKAKAADGLRREKLMLVRPRGDGR